MNEPKTVGEKFERDGPCLLMTLVVELAQKRKRIPFGVWRVELGDGWTMLVNGSKAPVDGVNPWETMMYRHGWPTATFNTVEGATINFTEEQIAAVLQRAINES